MEVKRIFRYLKGTIDYGLCYPNLENVNLHVYTDVDWAGCVDDRKSTSGGTIFLGDRLVTWKSKKHNYIS